VATRLVAVRAPRRRFAAALRSAWDAGDAVLPLPADAADGVVAAVTAALRPHVLRTVTTSGAVTDVPCERPLPCADDLALVVATSGSTGVPKGVELTRHALAAATTASLLRLGCRPGDRWVLALPTHHVAGVQVVRRAWAAGTEPVVVDGGDVAAIAAAGTGEEHVALVPTQLARLLAAGAPLHRFATILLGGAGAARELLAAARARGGRVVTTYGMTETGGGCVYDGVPLDGVEVAVRADGRIRLRGPVLLRAYRGSTGAEAAAGSDGGPTPAGDAGPPLDAEGWFTTGDLGRWDGDRLQVVGRVDDVVISGGENVPAGAVAATLRAHPAVRDAAIVGRPDREWGEVAVAVVVPTDAAAPPTLEALRAHVRTSHPGPHAPRELVLVDALPRDAMGKLRAGDLRRHVAAATDLPAPTEG
jgi:o-succinylbenzoate---CoA ligase